jgi:putative transposase
MIDRDHDLPLAKQAEILRVSRGSIYYLPRPVPATDLAIMRRLDRLHLEFPFAGSRMLQGLLVAEGCKIGRRHVKTLMQRMGHGHAVAIGVLRTSTPYLTPAPPTSPSFAPNWNS